MTGETDAVTRLRLPERTARARLVVVARAQDAGDYDRVLAALIDSGIRSVELTLTTPGTIARLPEIIARFGADADIGVGTVTDEAQLRAAIGAGAHYIVTPITDPGLVAIATDLGVPIIPGGLTPTELHASWRAGASAVKVFPASQVTPGYVKDLRGPFPGIEVVPSGGIDLAGADGLAARRRGRRQRRRTAARRRLPRRRPGCPARAGRLLRRGLRDGRLGMTESPAGPRVVTIGETMALFRTREIGSLRHASELALAVGGAESNVAIGAEAAGGRRRLARPCRG